MTVVKLLRGRYRLGEILLALTTQGTATAVPWCAEHDSVIKDGVCDWVWGNKYNVKPVDCRLEDPPVTM